MNFAAALLDHYDRTRRAMPWRDTADPYAIWVSEVMLQQTRVDAVVPYWERWMARFPTVDDLADADLDDVLRHWQGLGYYSRARNLHRAARMVRERHAGTVPGEADALRRLPGVGEYTAGAVASIAFGRRVPAVDGNVRRVLARVYDLAEPGAAELRRLADDLVPADRPGDFNQALMELGATLCTPRAPACDDCPVRACCRARALGVQEDRPRRKKRKPVPEEVVDTAVVVRDDGAFLLVRRPLDGLLGGLWEFPGHAGRAAVEAAGEVALERAADSVLRAVLGPAVAGPRLEPVVHAFTHKRVTYRPRVFTVGLADAEDAADGSPVEGGALTAPIAWVRPDELSAFALPVAQRKIAEHAIATLARQSSDRRVGDRSATAEASP